MVEFAPRAKWVRVVGCSLLVCYNRLRECHHAPPGSYVHTLRGQRSDSWPDKLRNNLSGQLFVRFSNGLGLDKVVSSRSWCRSSEQHLYSAWRIASIPVLSSPSPPLRWHWDSLAES